MTLKSITNFRLDNVKLTFEERETINFEDHYEWRKAILKLNEMIEPIAGAQSVWPVLGADRSVQQPHNAVNSFGRLLQ